MKIKELIERLQKYDQEKEVRIISKNHKSWMPITEAIADVTVSVNTNLNAILIEGV